MKNQRFLMVFVMMFGALLACNFTGSVPAPTSAPSPIPATESQPTQAPAPAPTEAPAATQAPAPTASNGKTITIGGVSFALSDQIATDISSKTTSELELPYINGPADLPMHTVVTLNNYNQQFTQIIPKIIVFRASEYAAYDSIAAKVLAAVQSPYSDGQPFPDALKCGLCVQIHGLTFQNGHGIRLLEQYNQAPLPYNNKDLFYFFRGVSNDGQFFVQVELPISAAFLPADDNPNTQPPAEGVPFNMNEFESYKTLIRQKFDEATPGTFAPTIEQLDALIQSLAVTGM
jgi:hypothetical protein